MNENSLSPRLSHASHQTTGASTALPGSRESVLERRPGLAGASTDKTGASLKLELASDQVEMVLDWAARNGNLSLVLNSGETSLDEITKAYIEIATADPKLSSSLMTGLVILASFPADGSSVANAEIARQLGITPSTSHRYVATLVVAGLVEKEPNKKYRLTRR